MKAPVLAGEVNLVVREELDLERRWKKFFQDLEEFFRGSFESDWEQKTGLGCREWGKYPHIQ